MQDATDPNWESAKQMVIALLNKHGFDATECNINNCCEDQDIVQEWMIPNGSTAVYITLMRTAEKVMFQVFSPLCSLPEKENRGEFYEDMLRLNATTLSCCALGIEDDDTVVVMADRSLATSSLSGLDEMLVNIKTIAATYSNEFINKYGAFAIAV